MDINTRIKNHFKYAYYRKLRDKAIAKMEEHKNDADDTEFKKWANIAMSSLNRCIEIPLN